MKRSGGFTLFELLLVISLIILLVAFTVPVLGLMRSVSLSQEIELVTGELKRARQTAIAENRTIEARFYSYPGEFADQQEGIRAIQIWKREDSGAFVAESALHELEEPVIISEETVITRLGTAVTPSPDEDSGLPPGHYYRAFQYRPDGTTNLNLSEQWYFTMHLEFDEGSPPRNFATILIEPLTGALRIYRP